MSKTQIDKLGEKLRSAEPEESSLRLLDEFRRSFGDAYDRVARSIRDQLGLEPTGRPAKSTTSIVEKLRRESIRLTQIQDIAGCRLVVSDPVAQDKTVETLVQLFKETTVIDRRARPSHGYRAVHIVVMVEGYPVEIQVRTSLQHMWAELSEKLSDVLDPSIKYGGGVKEVQEVLLDVSGRLAASEDLEAATIRGIAALDVEQIDADDRAEIDRLRTKLDESKAEVVAVANKVIASLSLGAKDGERPR